MITLKPVMYVANIADKDAAKKDTPLLNQIRQMAKEENAELVILCGRFEEEISGLDRNEQIEFLKEIGETESGLDRMIKTAYKLLGLITFFTAGEVEVRAWTTTFNSTGPKAASVIHSDFEKGFIRAEVMSYEDLNKAGTQTKVKEEGKLRIEGKEYIVQDGDVIYFRINA
ncbi:GTP-dependent nucleic acid-binding protein EngD family protein [Leptospira kirschneri str. 200801925]|nr:GTP-dependent nucleic acid-binding protein EngD family protein [Leptospira kirschneri str. 200801925]